MIPCMKRIIIACMAVFCLMLSFSGFSQPFGKVIEQLTVKSTVLNRLVRYTVYLPSDYESSQRSYPVVYLLHGYTDDNTGWLQFGEINRYADRSISEGIIPPMIIVMPNADSSWYINSYDGKENYEDFFIKEFMPAIEKTYRIKAEKRYRGIAGLSMGGYGTLTLSLKHPDLFSAAAPLSAAVFDDSALVNADQENYDRTFAQLYGRGLKGASRLNQSWYNNSILKMVATHNADDLKNIFLMNTGLEMAPIPGPTGEQELLMLCNL